MRHWRAGRSLDKCYCSVCANFKDDSEFLQEAETLEACFMMSQQSNKLCRPCTVRERGSEPKNSAKMAAPGESGGCALRPVINMGKRVTIAMIIVGILLSVTMDLLSRHLCRQMCSLAELNIFAMRSLHVELTSSRSNCLKRLLPHLEPVCSRTIPTIKNASTVEHCTVTEETSADFVCPLNEMNS